MKKALLWLIRWYQKNISAYRPPTCKYVPTCSAYAAQAVELHGAVKGTLLALWRFLRCNPFSKGGYDPVPKKKEKRAKRARD